jgi:hypothetical protein
MLMLVCSLLSLRHKLGTNALALNIQFKQAEILNPAFIMQIFLVLHIVTAGVGSMLLT